MKKSPLFILAVLVIASCSSPKYTYNFDYYNYNSGKNQQLVATPNKEETRVASFPEETLIASVSPAPVVLPQTQLAERPSSAKTQQSLTSDKTSPILTRNYKDMSREERKEFRKELKNEIKKHAKAIQKGDHVTAVQANGNLDEDLRLAIIFGAIGLVLTLFGGVSEAFWVLGVIGIIIGVYFLIRWLVRQ